MLRLVRSFIAFAEQIAVLDALVAAARRLAAFAVLSFAVAVLALASTGCAIASFWIWAARHWGPVIAPLLVAAILAVVALIIVGFMAAAQRRARRNRAERTAQAVQGLAQAPTRLLTLAAQGFLAGLTTPHQSAGAPRSR